MQGFGYQSLNLYPVSRLLSQVSGIRTECFPQGAGEGFRVRRVFTKKTVQSACTIIHLRPDSRVGDQTAGVRFAGFILEGCRLSLVWC